MANEIRLTVGDWVAVVQATNTQAVIDLLVDYESYHGLTKDPLPAPQVRLQTMLEHLVKYIETCALAQREAAAAKAAAESVDAPKWGAGA